MTEGTDAAKPEPTAWSAAQQPGPPPQSYAGQPGWGQPAGYPPAGYPPAYGMAFNPAAPYGVHPLTGIPYSDKSKTTAGLLQILLPFIGICGVGRLYAGHIGIGLVQLLGMFFGYLLLIVLVGLIVIPAIWLWTVIDGIVLLSGQATDGNGRPLRG